MIKPQQESRTDAPKAQLVALLRPRTNDVCVVCDAGPVRTVLQGGEGVTRGERALTVGHGACGAGGRRGSRWVPPPGDVEVVELVLQPTVRGELGDLRRLERLEGGRPAGRRVTALLLGREERPAQPVVVLRFYLQATDHVLLRQRRHGPRPPVLPDPLPAGDAAAAQERGQEHGACRGEKKSWLRARRGKTDRRAPPPPAGRLVPRRLTHQQRVRTALHTPGNDAGSGVPEEPRPARSRLPAWGFTYREKGRSRLREPMAFQVPGFKRPRALRRGAGLSYGSDPRLLREAAVSGRHPGQRDGPATASAGRRGQRWVSRGRDGEGCEVPSQGAGAGFKSTESVNKNTTKRGNVSFHSSFSALFLTRGVTLISPK